MLVTRGAISEMGCVAERISVLELGYLSKGSGFDTRFKQSFVY